LGILLRLPEPPKQLSAKQSKALNRNEAVRLYGDGTKVLREKYARIAESTVGNEPRGLSTGAGAAAKMVNVIGDGSGLQYPPSPTPERPLPPAAAHFFGKAQIAGRYNDQRKSVG